MENEKRKFMVVKKEINETIYEVVLLELELDEKQNYVWVTKGMEAFGRNAAEMSADFLAFMIKAILPNAEISVIKV